MGRLFARISTLLFGLLLLSAAPLHAGSISLQWNGVSGAAGYRVYSGTSSGSYSAFVDAGNGLSTTLDGLEDCTTYFLAVKAYNGAGESLEFSNEVSGWAGPSIASYDPVSARQGDQFTLTIDGANFGPGAQLQFFSPDLPLDPFNQPLVRIESFSVFGCNRIQALVSVEPGARGLRAMETGPLSIDFEVSNPDSVYGATTASLQIDFDEARADINQSDAATRNRIDGKDLIWQAHAHGSHDGDARYNPDADLDGDGWVDGEDLADLSARFGQCWNGSGWSAGACP